MKACAATIVFLVVAALATLHPAGASHHGSHVVVPPGQPGPRVGPSYLYPDPETTPGVTNPQVTQANIQKTICVRGWTGTIRPPQSYTGTLKTRQLQAPRFEDKNSAHYEEDHFISLELGGHHVDVPAGVFAAGATDIRDRHAALLRAKLAIDFELDRQTVAVVPRGVRHVEAGHRS